MPLLHLTGLIYTLSLRAVFADDDEEINPIHGPNSERRGDEPEHRSASKGRMKKGNKRIKCNRALYLGTSD